MESRAISITSSTKKDIVKLSVLSTGNNFQEMKPGATQGFPNENEGFCVYTQYPFPHYT